MPQHLRRLAAATVLAATALTSACSAADDGPSKPAATARADAVERKMTRIDLAVKADLKNLATALETYYVDHRSYPSPARLSTLATSSFYEVHLTKGTAAAAVVDADRETYCLRGWNAQGHHTETDPLYYSSADGGLIEEPVGLCASEDAAFTTVKNPS